MHRYRCRPVTELRLNRSSVSTLLLVASCWLLISLSHARQTLRVLNWKTPSRRIHLLTLKCKVV